MNYHLICCTYHQPYILIATASVLCCCCVVCGVFTDLLMLVYLCMTFCIHLALLCCPLDLFLNSVILFYFLLLGFYFMTI